METQAARQKRTRSEVREQYGHPWPWMDAGLFREHVIESDDDQKVVAEKWGTHPDTISKWKHRHGFAGEVDDEC